MRRLILASSIVLFCLMAVVSPAADYIPVSFRVLDVIVDVKWDGVEFEDTIEWMREKAGWNVAVRWKELDNLGVHKSSPVDIDFKSVPVKVVLDELIEQLGLAYQLDRHLLIISSGDYFNSQMHVAVYNVTDLLMSPSEGNSGCAPAADLRDAAKRPFWGDVMPGKNDFCKFEENKEQLEEAILMIEPNSWKSNGGKGTFTWIDGFLVVRNSLKVHELIGNG